jgi:DNA-binding transcriptional ArsR family regulator
VYTKNKTRRRYAMIRPGWAIKTKLDKSVRLRIPGYVLAALYQIRAETGLAISEIMRLLLEDALKDDNKLNAIFEPYKRYYRLRKQGFRKKVDFEDEELRV